jgi:hypothetical protein
MWSVLPDPVSVAAAGSATRASMDAGLAAHDKIVDALRA